MRKNTIQLPGPQGEWGSYISKYQPDSSKVLDNMFTAGSKNFVTDQTGMIDKRQGGVQWNRTTFGNTAKDSYEAIFESGSRHFLRVGGGILYASTGTGLFDIITSGYSTLGFFEWATYQDRVYGCNGINPPQVYDIVTSYGGVPYVFTTGNTKQMGAQAPGSAPTAGSPTAGGSVPVGPHSYKVTFLYYGSEESNGSPSSATQTTTSGNQTIPLTSIPIGGYGVTARRIYRDNNDGVYLLLTQVNDNTTTTFNDTLAQGSTPTPIPEDNNTPPTFNKIALWLDSLWIAPTGETNVLRYSLAGSPDIFPTDNFVRCQSDDVITAITVYNGKLFVHGLHSFGSIEGTTPDTFSYHNISNNIGCTDNRSIQIRSIVSVPTLLWLSDKGIYYSNGYTVEYMSDFIQDLVNLNLAQVNYSTNKNTQNSFTAFSGDTRSPGIDIASQPGRVTTITPEAVYNQTSQWEGGSVTTNLKTKDSNLLEVPTQFNPDYPSGSRFGDAIISGGSLTLPSTGNFTGESTGGGSPNAGFGGFINIDASVHRVTAVAFRIIPPRTGTITSVNPNNMIVAWNGGTSTLGLDISLYTDSFGVPGAKLQSTTISQGGISSTWNIPGSISTSFSTTGGTAYWIVFEENTSITPQNCIFRIQQVNMVANGSWSGGGTSYARFVYHSNGSPCPGDPFPGPSPWQVVSASTTNVEGIGTVAGSYTYTVTPVPDSGFWISAVYDSQSLVPVPNLLTISGSYPSGASSTVTLFTSATSDMASPNTQAFSSPNGANSVSISGLRYWQIRVDLATTNNLNVPVMGPPLLQFSITAIWVSQPINATSDNTGWGTLTFTGNVPATTSVTLEIATSPDNIIYSSFGPISGASTQPFAKVRITLVATPDDMTSPSVSSATLTWNLTSTIESSPIDTGTTPAGFNTFQWEEIDFTAGTVTAYIRTATTALGLSGATYVAVANGSFPNLSPFEFVQWKLVLMATANSSPVITSVTVNWFVGTGTTGVRAASIFYNKTYYLSVATIGSTFNNVLIQLDQFGKWRIQKDNSIGTFLLFFNSLYFTDGTNGNVYNGFIANTDNGTAIEMDVRTKAWNEREDIFLKIPRGLKITGIHTGTLIRAFYSIDRGNTFIEMFNEGGQTGYQTNGSKAEFVTLFVPDATTLVSGRTLIYRITSSDTFPCSIINFEPSMYTRIARFLNNG